MLKLLCVHFQKIHTRLFLFFTVFLAYQRGESGYLLRIKPFDNVLSPCMQVQVLYIMPLDHVKRSSYSGNSEARDSQSNATAPSVAGSGLSCACVDVAKAHLSPLSEEHCSSRNSPGNSPLPEAPFDLTGVIPLRRRYGAETNESKYSTPRQPPEEILSRVLRETSSHRSSPLQQYKVSKICAVDLLFEYKACLLKSLISARSWNDKKCNH